MHSCISINNKLLLSGVYVYILLYHLPSFLFPLLSLDIICRDITILLFNQSRAYWLLIDYKWRIDWSGSGQRYSLVVTYVYRYVSVCILYILTLYVLYAMSTLPESRVINIFFFCNYTFDRIFSFVNRELFQLGWDRNIKMSWNEIINILSCTFHHIRCIHM